MYSNTTAKYLIPSPKFGEALDGLEEKRAANIIDNQLYGCIKAHDGGHGIISDGTYVGTFVDGASTVTIYENKPDATVEGFINQLYFHSDEQIEVTGLINDTVYYLYAEAVSDLDETEDLSTYAYGHFAVTNYTTEQEQTTKLLLAIVTTTGSAISIETEPTGKLRIPLLSQHIANNLNPHTDHLYQYYLTTDTVWASGIVAFDNIYCENIVVRNIADVDYLDVRSGIVNYGYYEQYGVANFYGTANFASGLFASDLTVSDTLTVTGTSQFDGTVNFGDSVTLDSGVTINGRDIGVDYTNYNDHVTNITGNPHNVHASGIGALMKDGDTLIGNLECNSGIAIDTVDVSLLKPLVDGSTVSDSYHTHALESTARAFTESPRYRNTIASGLGDTATLTNIFENDDNVYNLTGDTDENRVSLLYRQTVPNAFIEWQEPFLSVNHKEDGGDIDESSIEVIIKDTGGTEVGIVTKEAYSNSWTQTDFNLTASGISSGIWTIGEAFSLDIQMKTSSGISTQIGTFMLNYNRNE